jgi:ABC-type multidrug transport system fused ATPase/permease subunit
MTSTFALCRKGIHQCSAVGTVIVMAMASLLAVAMVVATKLAMEMVMAIAMAMVVMMAMAVAMAMAMVVAIVLVLVLVLVVQAPWQERVHCGKSTPGLCIRLRRARVCTTPLASANPT